DAAVIDIKPGEFPNTVSLGSGGVLPVAVLTTPDFDATTVDRSDLSRLRFGDVTLTARVSPVRSALDDVDGDGDLDLVLFFSVPQIRSSGALVVTSTRAELRGHTTAGAPFVGTDSVRVVRAGTGPGQIPLGFRQEGREVRLQPSGVGGSLPRSDRAAVALLAGPPGASTALPAADGSSSTGESDVWERLLQPPSGGDQTDGGLPPAEWSGRVSPAEAVDLIFALPGDGLLEDPLGDPLA